MLAKHKESGNYLLMVLDTKYIWRKSSGWLALLLMSILLISAFNLVANAEQREVPGTWELWTVQTRGWGKNRQLTDFNVLEIDHSAEISSVESDAPFYAIWRMSDNEIPVSQAVVRGSSDNAPVGRILIPGKYQVVADLNGSKTATVRIILRPVGNDK